MAEVPGSGKFGHLQLLRNKGGEETLIELKEPILGSSFVLLEQ
jgi:hypothetical protein